MKNFLLLPIMLFILNNGMAQKLSSSVKSEISGIMAKQQEDWSKGDVESYMQGYWNSDSLCFVTKKGITYGWKGMLDKYKKSYPDKAAMGSLRFDILYMKALTKHKVLVIGKWILTREKDELSGYYTLIWEKIGKKWVIVLDHTS